MQNRYTVTATRAFHSKIRWLTETNSSNSFFLLVGLPSAATYVTTDLAVETGDSLLSSLNKDWGELTKKVCYTTKAFSEKFRCMFDFLSKFHVMNLG